MIFKSNLDNLKIGVKMFYHETIHGGGIEALDFISNLPNLIDGTDMFFQMNINTFASDEKGSKVNLDNLENGDGMFAVTLNGQYIHDQIQGLPKLKYSGWMFGDSSSPNTWTLSLPSLEYGESMFGTENLVEEFYSDLPKLKNGYNMLSHCKKFRGSLPSLINAYNMFSYGSLDSVSVLCIVSTIPDRTGLDNVDGRGDSWNNSTGEYVFDETYGGYIDIGIDCADDDESKNAFAQEIDYDTWDELIQEFTDKNWNVRFTFNPQTSSYSMRGGVAQSPVYAKLEEVIMPSEEDLKDKTKRIRKPHYAYTSADGSKFYNLHTYHESNTSHEGYTLFNSLGEAVEHYGLIEKQ